MPSSKSVAPAFVGFESWAPRTSILRPLVTARTRPPMLPRWYAQPPASLLWRGILPLHHHQLLSVAGFVRERAESGQRTVESRVARKENLLISAAVVPSFRPHESWGNRLRERIHTTQTWASPPTDYVKEFIPLKPGPAPRVARKENLLISAAVVPSFRPHESWGNRLSERIHTTQTWASPPFHSSSRRRSVLTVMTSCSVNSLRNVESDQLPHR